MFYHAFNRILQSLLVLLVMSFVIYGLMGLMPGDPIDLMISADPDMTSLDAQRLRSLYGLDLPITERYLNWLVAAFNGDFGFSRMHAKPVFTVLGPAFTNTLVLVGLSMILSLVIGLSAGIWAASKPYSLKDYTINLVAFAGISVPPFWLALLLIMVFSVFFGILPAGGMGTSDDAGLWAVAKYMILPVSSLTIASIGGHTRYMRAAMLETLSQDYIRTARAKGLDEKRVFLGHALRNALIPVTSIIALDFGALFSGALIT
ncbi:MAG: ABC transporter permease, partial [Rhodospirillales bacterium]|nr:ABC transporter permease [Rhodospirillales bacterium]